jgi:two-component system chemotaxis response regulator CheB
VRGFSVLLVDGSVSVRRLLTRAFEEDDRVSAVGTAANVSIGLAKIPQLNPDVVVVDLDLPDGDPFATVRRIRAAYPDLPVVVDSGHTHADAELSVRALQAGATRCVSRPNSLVGDALVARMREALVPVLQEVCAEASVLPAVAPPRPSADPWSAGSSSSGSSGSVSSRGPAARSNGSGRAGAPPDVLVLAASTGGPDALETFLGGLPASFPVPVLVVQHMPAGFTAQLARRLSAQCPLAVSEAGDRDQPTLGRVLLAPGGMHMRVHQQGSRRVVRLDEGTPENFCRPSADVLFRSVAATYGAAALGVVLTGMGADGTRGAAEMVHAGAEVLVQDERSSTVWGMPGSVSNAGLAAAVLPLDELASAVVRRTAPSRRRQS